MIREIRKMSFGDDSVIAPVVDAYWKELTEKALALTDVIPLVTIEYSTGMRTTAGRAYLKQCIIKLNVRLLAKNPEEIKPTLAHELAHLLTRAIYGDGKHVKSHGWQWQKVMRALGHEPSRTHSMDVAAFKAKTVKFEVTCGCRTHMVGKLRVKNILLGKAHYSCRQCRQRLRLTDKTLNEVLK